MSLCNSAMALRLDSHLKRSTPVPVQGGPFSALHFFPRASRSFPLLTQEELAETLDGSPYDLSDLLSPGLFESSNCSMPDLQLIRRIVSQVEFYLSDENLSKDAFLLKHVQKNKMGFVSIKLLTSFKKVKYLTRDWRVTLYALQFSELLEVNEEGTKVRRRNPIPEHLVNIPPSKMLLAWNVLPYEQTISSSLLFQMTFLDKITKLFSPFGDITSIRILRPGKKLPSDMKKYSSRYPELLTKCCALIEYESLESTRKAFEELGHNQVSSPGEAVKVVSLSGRGSKKKNMPNQEDGEEAEEMEKTPRKWTNMLPEGLQHVLEDSFFYGSSTESDSTPVSTPILPRNFFSAPVWPTTSLCNSAGQAFKPNFFSIPYTGPHLPLHKPLPWPLCPSPLSAPKLSNGTSELQKPPDSCWEGGLGTRILWPPKRRGPLCDQQQLLSLKPEPLSSVAPSKRMFESRGVRPEVIRLPQGPDGTRGFYNTIGRGKFVLRH
ncbi:la-related protein 6-like [Rhineura floridana]|uniref:la-related protein 6-like n=1 Tax=Rhineura floridana TaxID=261503 RepID=UPI002AC7EB3E|nr:la-related protein 6-like [Rhineura floridana]XP_061445001.1 la-related protein 6-like [Rhineura floridana]